jgi:hypothetical protein
MTTSHTSELSTAGLRAFGVSVRGARPEAMQSRRGWTGLGLAMSGVDCPQIPNSLPVEVLTS